MLQVAFLLAVCAVSPARAVEVTTLYTVEVPFDSNKANASADAYRNALTEVLVRVTGTTAAAESPQLAALFPNPARFVRQFRPGADNTLIVTLEGPAIERILRQSGASVWGSDRPLTLVWLAVDWGNGEREIVAAEQQGRGSATGRRIDRHRVLRQQIEQAATRRGIPVAFPLVDALDLQKVGFSDVWGGFDDVLVEASSRYQAPSVLVGRIRPAGLQAQRWSWYFDNRRAGWEGAVEEAIDRLADSLAATQVMSGNAPLETIELSISGIDSVAAYGRVQQYMENLRIADRVVVSQAAGDRISYAIDMRGGAERLATELARSGILERQERGYAIDSRSFGTDPRRSGNIPANNAQGAPPPGGGMRPLAREATLEYVYRPAPRPGGGSAADPAVGGARNPDRNPGL